MLLKTLLVLGTLFTGALAVAYNDSGITFEGAQDATNGLTIGFVFPPDAEQPTNGAEFIGHLAGTATTTKWAGIALGGKMLNNTLLIAWPSGSNITFSVRRAAQYGVPAAVTGPVVTTLKFNATASAWSWIFRCQNCTTWSGGSLPYTGTAAPTIAWAKGTAAPAQPASASSSFSKHSITGRFTQNMTATKKTTYKSFLAPAAPPAATTTPPRP